MDLLQAIIGFIVAVSALLGAVALAVRISSGNSKQALAIIDRELTQEKEESGRLRQRVTVLEDERTDRTLIITKLEDTVKTLTGQVTTLLTQMEDMQRNAKKSEVREQAKDEEIKRLKNDNARVGKQADDFFEKNKGLLAQHVIWEKMIDKVLPEKSNTTEPPAPVIVAGASGIEEK